MLFTELYPGDIERLLDNHTFAGIAKDKLKKASATESGLVKLREFCNNIDGNPALSQQQLIELKDIILRHNQRSFANRQPFNLALKAPHSDDFLFGQLAYQVYHLLSSSENTTQFQQDLDGLIAPYSKFTKTTKAELQTNADQLVLKDLINHEPIQWPQVNDDDILLLLHGCLINVTQTKKETKKETEDWLEFFKDDQTHLLPETILDRLTKKKSGMWQYATIYHFQKMIDRNLPDLPSYFYKNNLGCNNSLFNNRSFNNSDILNFFVVYSTYNERYLIDTEELKSSIASIESSHDPRHFKIDESQTIYIDKPSMNFLAGLPGINDAIQQQAKSQLNNNNYLRFNELCDYLKEATDSTELINHILKDVNDADSDFSNNLKKMQETSLAQCLSLLNLVDEQNFKALALLRHKQLNLPTIIHLKQYADQFEVDFSQAVKILHFQSVQNNSNYLQNVAEQLNRTITGHKDNQIEDDSITTNNLIHTIQQLQPHNRAQRNAINLATSHDPILFNDYLGWKESIIKLAQDQSQISFSEINESLCNTIDPVDPNHGDCVIDNNHKQQLTNHPITRGDFKAELLSDHNLDLSLLNTLLTLRKAFKDNPDLILNKDHFKQFTQGFDCQDLFNKSCAINIDECRQINNDFRKGDIHTPQDLSFDVIGLWVQAKNQCKQAQFSCFFNTDNPHQDNLHQDNPHQDWRSLLTFIEDLSEKAYQNRLDSNINSQNYLAHKATIG